MRAGMSAVQHHHGSPLTEAVAFIRIQRVVYSRSGNQRHPDKGIMVSFFISSLIHSSSYNKYILKTQWAPLHVAQRTPVFAVADS